MAKAKNAGVTEESLSPWERLRLLWLVALGSVLQRFVPITAWAGLLGGTWPVPQELVANRPAPAASGQGQWLSAAIEKVSAALPWKPSCLAQAFAGQRILKSRGVAGVVVIGLRPGKKATWPAHAWLVTEGHIVTGGAISHRYFPASAHSFGNPADALVPSVTRA